MMKGPTKKTVEEWRRTILCVLLLWAGASLVGMVYYENEPTARFVLLVLTLVPSLFMVVFALIFMRSNFRKAYGSLEMAIALGFVVAAIVAILSAAGSWQPFSPVILAVMALVTAIYFVIRGYVGVTDDEMKLKEDERSAWGRWFYLWFKNHDGKA